MNDQTTTLDQADEEVLSPTASDEALEAASGTGMGGNTSWGLSALCDHC
jgi:hypothetical protein